MNKRRFLMHASMRAKLADRAYITALHGGQIGAIAASAAATAGICHVNILLVTALAVAATAYKSRANIAGLNKDFDRAVKNLSDQGRSIYGKSVFTKSPRLKTIQLDAYFNKLQQKLALKPMVLVLDEPRSDGTAFGPNAFCISTTKGAIVGLNNAMLVQSGETIIGALNHEIGHFMRNDSRGTVLRQGYATAFNSMWMWTVPVLLTKGVKAAAFALAGITAVGIAGRVSAKIMSLAVDRQNEREADLIGARLNRYVGLGDEHFTQMLTTLSPDDQTPDIFQTHPDQRFRIKNIKQRLEPLQN